MGCTGERDLASPTGATLHLYVTVPPSAPRAVVQVNHGLAEHAARYGRFAGFLAERGYAVYAHDHRGHGRTRAPDAPLGTFAGTGGAAEVIADVLAVHELIAAEHPGLTVVAFGHSMGGLVALNFVARHSRRVAGAAIWNANVSAGLAGRAARAILAGERFRLGSDTPSRLLPRLTFAAWGESIPDRRTPFDWLSRDAAEVDKYVADPLCGWDASVGLWRDLFDLVFAGADAGVMAPVPRDLPFHLVGGGADPATDRGEAVNALATRLRRLGFQSLETTVYAETRHESLNELNRDEIMRDFSAWLDRAVADRPALR